MSGGTQSKPEKIYMHNANLLHVLSENNFNTGNIRETFFLKQLCAGNKLNYSKETDFIANAYVVKDNIETGMDNIIPLWLFWFLY